MRAKCVKVYLNPEKEDESRILDYLYYSGMPSSKAIINIALEALDHRDGLDCDARLIQAVKETIRDCLKGILPQGTGPYFDPNPQPENTDVEVSPLDFMDALGL